MRKVAARALLFAVAVCGAITCSGCLALRKAQQVEVQIQNTSIQLFKPAGGLQHGGETVVKIDNYANRPINMILAETNAPLDRLPQKLIDAVNPRDDSQIVGMTSRMDKAKIVLELGAIPSPSPRVATMHVYLVPGRRYVLFDKLGGYAQGIAIVLNVPKSR